MGLRWGVSRSALRCTFLYPPPLLRITSRPLPSACALSFRPLTLKARAFSRACLLSVALSLSHPPALRPCVLSLAHMYVLYSAFTCSCTRTPAQCMEPDRRFLDVYNSRCPNTFRRPPLPHTQHLVQPSLNSTPPLDVLVTAITSARRGGDRNQRDSQRGGGGTCLCATEGGYFRNGSWVGGWGGVGGRRRKADRKPEICFGRGL